jgi:dihydroneopterin aldolase
MGRDRIFIEGIKFHGFHGLTKSERSIGIRLSVDVELFYDLEKSGRADAVRHTVDYRVVHERILELGLERSHKLLESFAVTVLDNLLAEFPLDAVCVRVRKETPVLHGIVDSVGVEMSRTREEWES